jgi:maltooligosyltrehalose trehalohydrolase
MAESDPGRRLPVGAELLPDGGVHFRVWAPRRDRVEVLLYSDPLLSQPSAVVPLTPVGSGYFAGSSPRARDGTLYRYRLDGEGALPDPASRFQPSGPEGPSQVVDPATFGWGDDGWTGVGIDEAVIYEMHVGTFTPEGTWEAAARELATLADLGVTVVEMMPVADFPGRFGWGYDGVNLFAPTRLYGRPDDLRAFVDTAHRLGIAVILDVVYNHLGPSGNYLREFSPFYFSDRYENEWGDPLNFDGPYASGCREFFVENAGYWIAEFHFDGLRLDATQQIFDASEEHVLRAIGRRVRTAAAGRKTLLVAENEPQQVRLVRPESQGGYGLDALWNDDFHHSAVVALTGRNEAYYSDHLGSPQELVSAARHGFLYQGQRYAWQKKRRGSPTSGLHPATFVNFLENHDQVANSFDGARLHQLCDPGGYRAMAALLLLGPGTPMLFQGQEFASTAPFLYFADHEPELAAAVARGRKEFLAQFPSLASADVQALLADPASEETFRRSILDPGERQRHRQAHNLHRDLLRLRRSDPAFRVPAAHSVEGAVLGPAAFVLRFLARPGADRLLLVNLGLQLHLEALPEPLLAPPEGREWRVLWSSEDPAYGGRGTPPVETEDGWHLPGRSAIVLAAAPALPSGVPGPI